jgi:GTPase-associated system helical domain
VADFNFADSYRAAGLAPGPDALRARHEPFDKLRQALDASTAIDLTRIFFGLPVPRGTDWFRDAFKATDPSFSLVDNAREASVLAAGLLEGATADGKMYAALATLTTAANGLRHPAVRLELIQLMSDAIQERAVSNRSHASVDAKRIKVPGASKLSAEFTGLMSYAQIWVTGWIKRRTFLASRLRFRRAILHLGQP